MDVFKKGERVLVDCGHMGQSIQVIDSVTPSGLYKIGTSLYNTNGYIRGGNKWSINFILKLTPEKEKELLLKFKITIIKNFNKWDRLNETSIDIVYKEIKNLRI